jgi:hypothetical protein
VAGEASGFFYRSQAIICPWLAGPVNLRLCIIKEDVPEIKSYLCCFRKILRSRLIAAKQPFLHAAYKKQLHISHQTPERFT